jgi:tRNA(Ile2) C34 agmatinyltransferase TiaS
MVKWPNDWFKCKKCGERIRASDYNWEYYHLYMALKQERVCEECKRSE